MEQGMSDETTDGADKKTELVDLFKEIHRFTSPLSQHLQVIENRLTGLQEHNVSALSALINLHRMAFRMSVARHPEEADESDSITTFLSAIAGELEPYVDIVIPKVDDALDLDTMKVLEREVTDRPDLHNTVCGILQCGYRANSIAGGNVFEKASVAAFKFEGVITAVEEAEDAIVDLENNELGNSSSDGIVQIATPVKDIVLLSVCAIALFFAIILFALQFFGGADAIVPKKNQDISESKQDRVAGSPSDGAENNQIDNEQEDVVKEDTSQQDVDIKEQ
jgi:hypothetical protein